MLREPSITGSAAQARRSLSLYEGLLVSEPGQDLVALDDALKALVEVDARKSQVVEMQFFGGLSVEETAEALKVSPETVMRDWKLPRRGCCGSSVPNDE